MHINEMTSEDLKGWLRSEKLAFDKRKSEKHEQYLQRKLLKQRPIESNTEIKRNIK